MLINKNRIAIRVHSDEAGWPRGALVRLLQQLHVLRLELALQLAAWPASPQRAAIRRAARGLWDWTRYVWTQAEQTLGEELDIALDAAAFLEAIERPYHWDGADTPER